MTHNGKSRDDIARQANVVRSKLMRTVEQLDHRRHQMQGLRVEVEHQLKRVFVVGALVILASIGAAAYTVQRMTGGGMRLRRERLRLARRLWLHPDRAMRSERGSFLGEVIRSLLLAIVTTAVTFPARRAVTLLVQSNGSSGTRPRSEEEIASGG
jgi:hypothetical protein